MGTDDPAERDLIQGLIKLAAADVHGVRGNPRGVARNLEGARDRVRRVPRGDAIPELEVDLPGLLAAIDQRLADLAAGRPDRADRHHLEPPMNPAPDDPDHRRHRGGAPPARGSGRPAPRRRPRGQRVRGGPGARRGPRADVGVRGTGRGAAVGPAADARLPSRRAVGGRGRVPDPVRPGGRGQRRLAGWTPGNGPACRSATARRPRARATSPADAQGRTAAPRLPSQRRRRITRPRIALARSLWANAQPMSSRITKLTVPAPAAFR